MKRKTWIRRGAVVVVLCSVAYLGYQKWSPANPGAQGEMLALMPPDASAVLFADFEQLRRAPFLTAFYAWAPKPQADAEYSQFLSDTGLDYERDFDRMAIAVLKRAGDTAFYAIVDGKFDRRKISEYASKSGSVLRNGGREIYSLPIAGSLKKITFTFLSKERIAVADAADLGDFLGVKKNEDAVEWRARFQRLAGSPVFAVIRQDAAAGTELAAQAPGGLRSPELSSLLDQLKWITLAGKPDNDRLRIVAEGECSSDGTVRQLVELLNGVVILAQAGLNDPQTRRQLDPAAREAYLELLKSADVSKIDRGDSKSVRLIFEVTPQFLEAARTAAPVPPPKQSPSKPLRQRGTAQKKGHT